MGMMEFSGMGYRPCSLCLSGKRIKVQNLTRRQTMKRLFAGLCGLALLFLLFPLALVQAQSLAVATKTTGPFGYDIAQEVTLNGTVSSLLTKPSPGMFPGSHLLLATLSGPVDISLGMFGLRGKGALSVEAGQQVQVSGVMKTLGGKQVFLARIVTVGSHQVYAIRNEHGVPVSPQARERALKRAPQKGGTL
jgi:hypothetical protein